MADLQFVLLSIPILAFVCGVGIHLLLLCYLKRNPSFSLFWKKRDINQCQDRVEKRRKGETLKGLTACQREADEAKQVLSLRQRHLGQFRQLLCPDPSCEVCNRATAEVNRLLLRNTLEYAATPVSPLASTVPVTESSLTLSPAFSAVPPGDLTSIPLPEPSPPPVFTLSPNPATLLDESLSPSPLGYSPSPKILPHVDPKFPVDNYPPLTNDFPPLPLHETERVDGILQPEATLCLNTNFSTDCTLSQDTNALSDFPQVMNPTDSYACHHEPSSLSVSSPPDCTLSVTQSQSISILKKSVPDSSSPGNSVGLSTYVPAIRNTDHLSPSCSELSWCQTHDETPFLPPLSDSDFQQKRASLPLPGTCLWEGSATKHMKASGLSFLGLNLQDLSERQIKKRMPLQTLEKTANEEGLLLKPLWPEDPQTFLGNSLHSSDVQEATTPRTGWNTKGNPKLLYVKTLGKNLQQKYSQLFWGLPSLHSESLVATVLVSSSGTTLDPHFVLFNGIGKASGIQRWGQESPLLPHSHPLALSNVHPNPTSQTKLQFHPITFTQFQPQAHLQSRLPILPSSSLSQIRDCGMSFHRCQNESDSNISTENQHLKWHALQKQQEHLWGLVSKLHKSQGAICPHTPNIPLVSHTSQACVPVSFLPGHFCMASESQEKPEINVPERLIPHQCLHAFRNIESLALLEPQCQLIENFQQKSSHAYSQLSDLQIQNNKDIIKTEWCLSGNFNEKEKFHGKKDIRQNFEHILGKSSQRISEFYLMKDLGTASDKKSNCVFRSRYGRRNELLSVSMNDTEMKTILRLHLSRKFWQITMGRIPICVCRSWLADGSTSLPSGVSHTNIKNTNLANTTVGKAYCQITTIEPCFLDSNTRQVLESHIIRFQVNQMWGLPLKVRESIKFYMLREAKTWPLPQFDFLSSAACISGVAFKGDISKSLEGSSKTFQGNNMRTKSVSSLDQPCPAIPCVGSEEQEDLKLSLFDVKNELTYVDSIKDGRQTSQSVTTSISDKAIQTETVLDYKCSPEVPTRLADAGYEPMEKNVSSSFRVEMVQNEMKMEKNSEHFSMLSVSREIFKAEELCARQSPSSDILTTTETGSSQEININMIKAETTLTTKCPSTKILDFRDDESKDCHELKFKLESGEQSKAQGQSNDMHLYSDKFTHKSSQTHFQNISCGDMEVSRELHAHVENSGMSMEQIQDSRVPEQVFRRCQGKNVLPDAKRVALKDRGPSEVLTSQGSEDSGRGTLKGRKKRETVEDGELEDTSPSLSENVQFSSESYLRKKMRQLFQWLDCKRRNTGRESSPPKVKFMSTVAQHQDPLESATVFMSYESPEAIELMTAIGKILEKKVAGVYESDGSELRHQEKIESKKGNPLNEVTLSDPQQREWASMKASSKEAASADQSCLSNVRQDGSRIKHPQRVVAFPGQIFWESPCPSPSFRESMPHPSPICVHQVCQVSSATLPTDEDTVMRDLTLLFKQKTLLQHFQKEKIFS